MIEAETRTDTGVQLPVDGTANAHGLRNTLLLVLVTMIWGGTFLVVKDTVRISGPFTFLALTYTVGTVALALIFRKRLMRITRDKKSTYPNRDTANKEDE